MDNVRDVADKFEADNDILIKLTKEYGEDIQGRLLDGLLGSYDGEGKTFKSLSPKTIKNRRSKGITGTKPLIEKKGILNFLNSPDLIQSGKVQIKLKTPSEEYMLAQNEGFSHVPARKWYGIPKTYREGGTKYNELLKKFVKRLEEEFGKALKFT